MKIRAFVLVFVLIAAGILAGCGARRRYESAHEMLREGRYAEAQAVFLELGEHMEAESAAEYARAAILFADGEFAAAASAFNALGGFLDAADRAALARNEINYMRASDYLAGGAYERAAEVFESLGDFKDSREMAELSRNTIAYNDAVSAMNRGRGLYLLNHLVTAFELFIGIRGFEDVDEILAESLPYLVEAVNREIRFIVRNESIVVNRRSRAEQEASAALVADGVVLIETLLGDNALPLDNDTRALTEEAVDGAAFFPIFVELAGGLFSDVWRGPTIEIWDVLLENQRHESFDILLDFFLPFLQDGGYRIAAVQTLNEHLDAGLHITLSDYCRGRWLRILNHNFYDLNEALAFAALYQRFFPGRNTGRGLRIVTRISPPENFQQIIGTQANGGLLVAGYNQFEVDMLFSADPRIVAGSLAEVEFVVETTHGHRRTGWTYDAGTIAVRDYAQVRLLRYPGGSVIWDSGRI